MEEDEKVLREKQGFVRNKNGTSRAATAAAEEEEEEEEEKRKNK